MIERGHAYFMANQDAERIAFSLFQVKYGDKDSFGVFTAVYLLGRLLMKNAY